MRILPPLVTLAAISCSMAISAQLNTLTPQETKAGWQMLWDGKTMTGWHSAQGANVPVKGVRIENGVLTLPVSKDHEGDLVTDGVYTNFELLVDYRLVTGANSGIKYFVNDAVNQKHGSVVGFEYQLLDDNVHPDARLGRNGDRKTASLYDILPATANKPYRSPGEWSTAKIVVRGTHGEHWLNGLKVLDYDRNSPEFRNALALSKFHDIQGFGDASDGHLLLQDHGDEVSFRNIKIRMLPASSH